MKNIQHNQGSFVLLGAIRLYLPTFNFSTSFAMRKLKQLLLALFLLPLLSVAQKGKSKNPPASLYQDSVFSGLHFRSIGPAFMSGRIADIAIHPTNENIRYVAVGSGGVWKTENAGTTWQDVFKDQPVYSTGCVTIDPHNPHTVYVGTGENVGGRHVGFGDGLYRSTDGGQSWENIGLKQSEHISKIIVHPDNPQILFVAAQGPLWSKGGERGFYRSADGGKTWTNTLQPNEWTGVTDIAIDPRNPNRLYAATWQRHRTVAAYMGGGPGSGLYRSEDGGLSWVQLKQGLPASNMGKIGLAISPQNPDVLYAAIELDRRSGAVYRSTDRGATWEKRSNAVAGATGPHYYQELYASPHKEGRLYLVDVRMQVSEDGGKTFHRMKEEHKHSDNHAIAFKKNDPNYLMVGTDGGLYETFDLTKTWRFVANLPVTQFYKLAVDDAEPFYNIYGGTQDNNTQGGPSRTDNPHGIQNSDWRVVLDWDGHQPATEPGNPNIMYGERQEGTLSRIDLATGEIVDIQPQPGKDEPHERFNWDAPILVSPHNPQRIYFASYRVWRSDNRGDAWQSVSGDLSRNEARMELDIMGRQQSIDNAWDFLAMSNYNTITSLAESPLQEGLLYAGTDDGLIQISENGGDTWRRVEVSTLPGVPERAFVNDIRADLHDANTVYICLDNHKNGDFSPYLYKSTDRGKSWMSIKANLPNKLLVWRIVQDHVKPELLFLGTEFGVYFSPNAGQSWVKIKGNMPTIPVRDLTSQRREDDLVLATFGRGFYVFDDIEVFRAATDEVLKKEVRLFEPRDAWWFFPRPHLSFDEEKGSMGHAHFTAPNPPHGVSFTYYLKDGYRSVKEERQRKEKKLGQADIPFEGWEAMEVERVDESPKMMMLIKDGSGKLIRKLAVPHDKGFHRVSWDMKYPTSAPLDARFPPKEMDADAPDGMPAIPGTYSASLVLVMDGKVQWEEGPVRFQLKPLYQGSLEGKPLNEVNAFWRKLEALSAQSDAVRMRIDRLVQKVEAQQVALERSAMVPGDLDQALTDYRKQIQALKTQLDGDPLRLEMGEKVPPTMGERIFSLARSVAYSSYGPTETNGQTVGILEEELATYEAKLTALEATLAQFNAQLEAAGAPRIQD